MKALVAHDYGPLEQLAIADLDRPAPGPGQLLLRVSAASVNPFDLKLLSGAMKQHMPLRFPYVPGMDVAGTVAEVSEGVTTFSVGDEVFGMLRETPGSLAEYAIANAESTLVARRPAGLEPVRAAAVPEVGLTALTMAHAAGVQQGESVLVVGATGGVGTFLVQLAAKAGARVIACARPEHADYVRSLGAIDTIDHSSQDVVEEARRRCPGGVDVLFDVVNLGPALVQSAGAVRDGGRVVSALFGPEEAAYGRGLKVSNVFLAAQPGQLYELGSRAADGDLRVEVSRTYAFDEAAQALIDLSGTHKRGKLVVTVS